MKQNNGTYYTLAKWFKWSSLIVILVPLVTLIMGVVNAVQTNDIEKTLAWYDTGIKVLSYISLVAAIIWSVLNIIMFFAAGTVRTDARAGLIRLWLLIGLVLAISPIIITIIYDNVPDFKAWEGAKWLVAFIPLITIIGYTTGAVTGRKIQDALK